MRFYWLIVAILGVWRVTHLLHAEDGPWSLLVRLRRLLGNATLGHTLDCFYCLSVWIAVPFAGVIGHGWKERLLLWPALSGAAALLQRATTREETPPPAQYFEDKDPPDVLRQEPDGSFSERDILSRR